MQKKNNKMTIYKRILGVSLAGIMLTVGFLADVDNKNVQTAYAVTTSEEKEYSVGNSIFKYKELEDGTIEISDYEGEDTKVIIPDKINGKNVTSIGAYAFYGRTNLKDIEIPLGVTNIGDGAFAQCYRIISIKIPNSIVNIGSSAFEGCSDLTGIEIPQSVRNIGKWAFMDCSGLTSIKIPNGVTIIEEGAFDSCSSLIDINIPSSVNEIGEQILRNCVKLEKIIVDTNNKHFKTINGVLYDIDGRVLIVYPIGNKVKNYIIPNGTERICHSAFENCSNLTSIEIPLGVKNIEDRAFLGCTNLANINLPTSVISMGKDAFCECSSLTSIEIPSSITEIKMGTFDSCSSLVNIKIPSSILEIEEFAFSNCSSLTNIEIPFNITNIEACTFYKCNNLKSIKIPSSVVNIGYRAFLGCENLKSVEIPSKITNIEDEVFEECDLLTILGVKDSIAQSYAKNNNIQFNELEESKSEDDIQIIYGKNNNTKLAIKTMKIKETDDVYKNIISDLKTENISIVAYDINIYDGNNIVQPVDNVTVKIPCPANYDGTKCKVYRYEDDGNITNMKATYQDGYMVFDTKHFSTYILSETELKSQSDIIYGDANGDGQINTQDAVLIKKYLAEYDNVDINLEASDVNGDGEVTSADAVLLLKYLAEYDVTLGR